MTLEERNEALAEQVAEMALTARALKKSLAFKEHIIASLKLDRTHEEAAVVAYLRDCAHRDAYRNHNRNRAEALWDAANIVESGEHRREEEK